MMQLVKCLSLAWVFLVVREKARVVISLAPARTLMSRMHLLGMLLVMLISGQKAVSEDEIEMSDPIALITMHQIDASGDVEIAVAGVTLPPGQVLLLRIKKVLTSMGLWEFDPAEPMRTPLWILLIEDLESCCVRA